MSNLDYAAWISGYVLRRKSLRGMCLSAAREMIEHFPELRLARGFFCGGEHAWCVAPDGSVVDPTRAQYPVDWKDVYEEFRPGDTVRVGRCMNCGEGIYVEVDSLDNPAHARSFCDASCAYDFERSFAE